jgi:long-chain fatty acid transport protein
VVVRTSDLDLRRRQAAVDPFDGMAKDIASINLSSDTDTGVGFNIGVLHRTNDFLSWGFSYRSAIEVDYSGNARVTQIPTGNPVFDAIIAPQFPFDENLSARTSIEFPDQASLGLGFQFSPEWLFEVDFNWTGWSSFDMLNVNIASDPSLDTTRVTDWDDAVNVRGGVVWDYSETATWRFGLYFDETPQPIEDVGPLIADADQIGFTLGYGLEAENLTFDIALLYIDFDDRTVKFPDSNDGFYGTYGSRRVSLGLSFGW